MNIIKKYVHVFAMIIVSSGWLCASEMPESYVEYRTRVETLKQLQHQEILTDTTLTDEQKNEWIKISDEHIEKMQALIRKNTEHTQATIAAILEQIKK